MTDRLVITDEMWNWLRKDLFSVSEEACAILYASESRGDVRRFLVNEVRLVPLEAYARRQRWAVELRPEFVAEVEKHARLTHRSVVFVHTHPGSEEPVFSTTDDLGERRLHEYLSRRSDADHLSLVLGFTGARARKIGTGDPIEIVTVGRQLQLESSPTQGPSELHVFDRQVRAFGQAGQDRLASLRVGIVGLGGTGSLVAQQLAHLGVRNYVLIDDDQLDPSNLNRVVGATRNDIGVPKVTLARAHILSLQPDAEILPLNASVLLSDVAKRLVNVDVAFCCTDSHGSRAVLNTLAYQYYVPVFDMGVVIVAREGKVERIAGRVQMLSPGIACLTCGNILDSEMVRRDLMTKEHVAADPYFIGAGEPQPAVISVNSMVASLAVTMFLASVTPMPFEPRHLWVDGISGRVRPISAPREPTCVTCSPFGALGRADSWPLPARRA